METFPSLSIKGDIPGTREIDSVINDPGGRVALRHGVGCQRAAAQPGGDRRPGRLWPVASIRRSPTPATSRTPPCRSPRSRGRSPSTSSAISTTPPRPTQPEFARRHGVGTTIPSTATSPTARTSSSSTTRLRPRNPGTTSVGVQDADLDGARGQHGRQLLGLLRAVADHPSPRPGRHHDRHPSGWRRDRA